ncbi:MAG TPA: hypothetical protein VMU51_22645 [Mycobacteriales bacterium]|nr:hypothetical protein [Mycobacteriales bacterium]
MPAGINVPVLIGLVPLFTATNLVLTEGYKTAQLAGSRLTQLVTPTERGMTIDATLVGSTRLVIKKGLEAMALTSRALAAATAPLMALAGIPVVSGMVISLDMQITQLKFTQSNKQRDAIDVSITLVQVPRSSITAIVGEALDLALALGTLAIPTVSDMVPLKRQFGG